MYHSLFRLRQVWAFVAIAACSGVQSAAPKADALDALTWWHCDVPALGLALCAIDGDELALAADGKAAWFDLEACERTAEGRRCRLRGPLMLDFGCCTLELRPKGVTLTLQEMGIERARAWSAANDIPEADLAKVREAVRHAHRFPGILDKIARCYEAVAHLPPNAARAAIVVSMKERLSEAKIRFMSQGEFAEELRRGTSAMSAAGISVPPICRP